MKLFAFTFLFAMALGLNSVAQNTNLIDFSGDSAEANGITLIGAGFGEYPMPDVTFGDIPSDNAFEGATDGRGMIITADPGEGAMIQTTLISTSNCALLRCSVRLSAPHASLYLASVDQGESTFVSTITPSNPMSFVNQYQRIADFFLPPSTGFQGIIQVVNTSDAEGLTVYIDNFEIIEMGPDGINVSIEDLVGSKSPIPENTPTPTPTPTQSSFNGETETVQLDLPEGSIELVMVKIPAGTFEMGSDPGGYNEKPIHKVTISKDFYIGKYEVTQAQWQTLMGDDLINTSDWIGDNLPIQKVSWNDCKKFISNLNKMGQGTFRLPTEAEWEYACRAGTTTDYYWGYGNVGDYAWYSGNSDYTWGLGNSERHIHEVGTKLPNDFGLFDMSGNLWEWCQDWYDFYSSEPEIDPIGKQSGAHRVLRGGSYDDNDKSCRSASRQFWRPDMAMSTFGFRIAASLNQ